MKKFYEQPVVEITVFDEECIMTSAISATDSNVNQAELINSWTTANNGQIEVVAEAYDDSIYKW